MAEHSDRKTDIYDRPRRERSSCAAKPLLDLCTRRRGTPMMTSSGWPRKSGSPTIKFRALCGIFNIVMADLLQHYQVKHPPKGWEGRASFVVVVTNGGQTWSARWFPGQWKIGFSRGKTSA
ncbi:hypothetical protein DL95DRAFT_418215 [Leptodontidium sp. 2 PMI_412]|nr:hypothetical protein DL95DRAFT_418215 [Leptodontidium sp. 2 PMI_412]